MRHQHMMGSMNDGTAYCQCLVQGGNGLPKLLHNGDVIQREGKSIWPMQQAIDQKWLESEEVWQGQYSSTK